LALLTGHSVPRKNLVILDLSRIPFETVDITVALLTRLLYEFNFWCDHSRRSPLLLVYEEAHNYIPADRPQSFSRRAVERVAKEGRKYGVGALVVSQRPMEVSETVLSQCNSFIIMRMSNPADQAYVSKVVSEQFSGLVGTLAQLRPGEAYAVGEAVPMPMRTQIYLTKQAPDSGDADFFAEKAAEGKSKDISTIVEAWWRQERPTWSGRKESSGSTDPAGRAREYEEVIAKEEVGA
jgi:DNA helicase HerA-like ATPase